MEIIPELVPVVLLVLPFFVTYAVLHVVLFRPLLQYLEDREAVSGTAEAEAKSFEQATADKMTEVEAQLAAARRDITELRKDARTEAQAKEAEILAAARKEAEGTIEEAVARIGKEKKAAATTLKGTAKVLSADIAAQVLGRSPKEA